MQNPVGVISIGCRTTRSGGIEKGTSCVEPRAIRERLAKVVDWRLSVSSISCFRRDAVNPSLDAPYGAWRWIPTEKIVAGAS